jgi:hypothetical protein
VHAVHALLEPIQGLMVRASSLSDVLSNVQRREILKMNIEALILFCSVMTSLNSSATVQH